MSPAKKKNDPDEGLSIFQAELELLLIHSAGSLQLMRGILIYLTLQMRQEASPAAFVHYLHGDPGIDFQLMR